MANEIEMHDVNALCMVSLLPSFGCFLKIYLYMQ